MSPRQSVLASPRDDVERVDLAEDWLWLLAWVRRGRIINSI